MRYKITQNSNGVSVKQYAFAPLAMGVITLIFGFLMLEAVMQGVVTDLSGIETLDYLAPRFFCIFAIAVGGGLILFAPYLKQVKFFSNFNALEFKENRLARRKNKKFNHQGMETLFVKDVGTDGNWYMPMVSLEGGEVLEIGFGCPSEESAQSVSEEIKREYNRIKDNRND